MAAIEKKRGALLLFSNLTAGDSFVFSKSKDKKPHRYIKFEYPFNHYIDSGIFHSMRPNTNILDVCKKTKKNCEVMFLQSNPDHA